MYYQVLFSPRNPKIMQKPKLLDQVRNLMRLRHLSHKTERAYISYIREFILFHDKKHPQEMGVNEIREYLTHLAVREKCCRINPKCGFQCDFISLQTGFRNKSTAD